MTWNITLRTRRPREVSDFAHQKFCLTPIFLKSEKYVWASLTYSQDFSKICCRVKTWSAVLRPGRIPHWVISSFGSIFRGISFQGTRHIFPGRIIASHGLLAIKRMQLHKVCHENAACALQTK